MFESEIEKTIVITAFTLWIATGWYLNLKLRDVHTKLDHMIGNFHGLREYLYSIDPQFDDERSARKTFEDSDDDSVFYSGYYDSQLRRVKKEKEKRTLDTPFYEANST